MIIIERTTQCTRKKEREGERASERSVTKIVLICGDRKFAEMTAAATATATMTTTTVALKYVYRQHILDSKILYFKGAKLYLSFIN